MLILPKILKKQLQSVICSNVYDDVKNFEFCGFIKNPKILNILRKKRFFLQIKKSIHNTLRVIFLVGVALK